MNNYHELSLRQISQMRGLQNQIAPQFLDKDIVKEVEQQDAFFGLLYLIGLMKKLKVQKDQSLNQFVKGAFYKRRTPFIIGITGPVAVGKSTLANKLAESLHNMDSKSRVEIVSTDNFLHSNAYLKEHGLMDQKGFPASFDNQALNNFLIDRASFNDSYDIPVYDHQIYDLVPNKKRRVRACDYLIVEGVNILQDDPDNFRSFTDPIDLSIYLSANNEDILNWFIERFEKFREGSKEGDFYQQYAKMTKEEAQGFAKDVYLKINQPNFEQNIEPSKVKAQVIVEKLKDHHVSKVMLRDY